MKSDHSHSSFPPFFLLIMLTALLVVIASLAAYASWGVDKIQNDGVQYLSTARNVIDGNGFSTDTLAFGPHFQKRIPGPQTVWPPGYPALIVLGNVLTNDLQLSALWINIAAHFAGSLILFLLLLRCGVSRTWSLAGAVVFYLTDTQWRFIDGLLSEPVFSVAILASLLALPNIKTSSSFRYLICGLLVASTLLIRHPGVLFIAGAGIGVFLLLFRQVLKREESIKGLVVKCLFLGGPGILLFAAFMLRIRIVTDTAISVSGADVPENIYYYVSSVFSELGWFFGFYAEGAPLPEVVGKILNLLFVALLAVWMMLCIGRWIAKRKEFSTVQHDKVSANGFDAGKHRDFRTVLITVVVIHTLLFFLYFGFCTLTDVPLKFSRRYFFQLYSGLLALLVIIVFAGSRKGVSNRENGNSLMFGNTTAFLGGTAFILFAIAQVHAFSGTSLAHDRNREILRMLDFPVTSGSYADNPTSFRKLVDTCFNIDSIIATSGKNLSVARDEGIIWSDQGQILHQYLGIPTIALANRYQNDEIDFVQLEEDVEAYNIRLMVLVPDWAFENEWKIPKILEWAESNDFQIWEVAGYVEDLSRNTYIIAIDSNCTLAN